MPALEQLNIRVTPRVKQRFRDRARREGLSQAQLLEALLKQRGSLPAPDPEPAPAKERESPVAADPPGPAHTHNLVTWLSTRLGMPRALVARAVSAGRVTVAGVPWTAEGIPPEMLKQPVAYDGEPVR